MKRIFIVTLVMVMMTAGFVAAKNRGGNMDAFDIPPGKWWRMPGVVDQLAITPDEQNRLDELFVNSRRAMIDLKSQVEREKLELEILLEDNPFNEAACMDRFDKLMEARKQVSAERFQFLVETRKLLGKERFDMLKEKFHEHRRKMMRERLKERRRSEGIPE